MKDIYVITKSVYSDYRIVGTTTEKELAHSYVKLMNEIQPPSFEDDEYRVEIFKNGEFQ